MLATLSRIAVALGGPIEREMRAAVGAGPADQRRGFLHVREALPSDTGRISGIFSSLKDAAAGPQGWRWQTVTPAVLPAKRPQGKISGGVRAEFEQRLALAVVAALRHAGVRFRASVVAVQREPFFARECSRGCV